MTNVSKQPLPQTQRRKLLKQFATVFSSAGEQKMAVLFMELFTESEQIMFINRAGIIFMLMDEVSNYEIAQTLLVSETTVKSVKMKYEAGGYDAIVQVMRKRSFDSEQFWAVIDTVLRAGMPPRGKGRWKAALKYAGG